jgi:hypothetical protein
MGNGGSREKGDTPPLLYAIGGRKSIRAASLSCRKKGLANGWKL